MRILAAFIAVAAFGLLPVSRPAWAAEPISVSSAVETALRVDPALAALARRAEALRERQAGSLAPAEPQLTAIQYPDRSAEYDVSQAVGFPGKALAAAKTLQAQATGLQAQSARRRAELTALVKTAYASLWALRKRREVLADERSAFLQILAAAKRRSVKDTTTQVEYLNSQVLAAQIEDTDVDLSAQEQAALGALDTFLGRQPDSPLELTDSGAPPLTADLDVARIKRDGAASPIVLEAQSTVEVARRRVASSRAAILPDFQFTAFVNNPESAQFGAGLTVPVWSWFGERRAINAARQDLSASSADETGAKRTVAAEVNSAIARVEALEKRLDLASHRTLPVSQESFTVALKNYPYGKVDFPALLQAADGWFGGQERYYSLLARYAAARADLEALIGRPLP